MIKCKPNIELGIIFFDWTFILKKILFEPNLTLALQLTQFKSKQTILSQFQVMITSY